MRRSLTDFEWQDEVIRRWQRRRWRVQQREKAVRELREALAAALEPMVLGLDRQLRRWPALYRWLSR